MQQYLNLLNDVYFNGTTKGDRTGTGTASTFGKRMVFKMSDGFPLITTRKINPKNFIYEILWYFKENQEGSIKYLKENNVNIWNEWAFEDRLGPMYPTQFRSWGGDTCVSYETVTDEDGVVTKKPIFSQRTIDQLAELTEEIKTNPNSRRLVMSTWNVQDLPKKDKSPVENAESRYMALAPCLCLFQFNVVDGNLSLQVYQRSADAVLGVPNNIAGCAMFLHVMAHSCGLIPDELIWIGGDVHIYSNHFDGVLEQLSRKPSDKIPQLHIVCNPKEPWEYEAEDFVITDYEPQEHIKFAVSV